MWGRVLPTPTSRCTLLHLPAEEHPGQPPPAAFAWSHPRARGWHCQWQQRMKGNTEVSGRANKPCAGFLLYHSTEIQVNGGFTFFASSPSDCTYIHAKRLLTECCTIRLFITGSFPSLSTLFCRTTDMGRCCWDSREVRKTQLRRVTFTIHFSKGQHHYKRDKITTYWSRTAFPRVMA